MPSCPHLNYISGPELHTFPFGRFKRSTCSSQMHWVLVMGNAMDWGELPSREHTQLWCLRWQTVSTLQLPGFAPAESPSPRASPSWTNHRNESHSRGEREQPLTAGRGGGGQAWWAISSLEHWLGVSKDLSGLQRPSTSPSPWLHPASSLSFITFLSLINLLLIKLPRQLPLKNSTWNIKWMRQGPRSMELTSGALLYSLLH